MEFRFFDPIGKLCAIMGLTLETEISNCMDSLLKIEKTYAFSQLLNDDSAGNALDRWDIYELRAQMKMALRGSMEDMFLYFSGQDIVVSAPDNSTCSSKICYRTYYGDARQSYEVWAALLQPSVSVRCAAIYADGLPCLAISRALPTADRKNLSLPCFRILWTARKGKALWPFMAATARCCLPLMMRWRPHGCRKLPPAGGMPG